MLQIMWLVRSLVSDSVQQATANYRLLPLYRKIPIDEAMRYNSISSLALLAPTIVYASLASVTRIEKRQQVVYSIPDYQITGPLDPQYLTTSGSNTKFIGPVSRFENNILGSYNAQLILLPFKRSDCLAIVTTTSASMTTTETVNVALYTGQINNNEEYSIIISPALQQKLDSALSGNSKRGVGGGVGAPDFLIAEFAIAFSATMIFGFIAIPAVAVAAIIWNGYQLDQHPPLAVKVPNTFLNDFHNCPAQLQKCDDPACMGGSDNVCSKGIGCESKCPHQALSLR